MKFIIMILIIYLLFFFQFFNECYLHSYIIHIVFQKISIINIFQLILLLLIQFHSYLI